MKNKLSNRFLYLLIFIIIFSTVGFGNIVYEIIPKNIIGTSSGSNSPTVSDSNLKFPLTINAKDKNNGFSYGEHQSVIKITISDEKSFYEFINDKNSKQLILTEDQVIIKDSDNNNVEVEKYFGTKSECENNNCLGLKQIKEFIDNPNSAKNPQVFIDAGIKISNNGYSKLVSDLTSENGLLNKLEKAKEELENCKDDCLIKKKNVENIEKNIENNINLLKNIRAENLKNLDTNNINSISSVVGEDFFINIYKNEKDYYDRERVNAINALYDKNNQGTKKFFDININQGICSDENKKSECKTQINQILAKSNKYLNEILINSLGDYSNNIINPSKLSIFDLKIKDTDNNGGISIKEVCEQKIEYCSDAIGLIDCKDDKGCQNLQTQMIKNAEQNYMSLQVNLNSFGSILSLIGSRDQNAINTLKLFGIEDNLENVPIFLREPFPSYICLSKIKGYLDAEDTDSQGGVTRYGCDKSNGNNYLTNDYQDPRCNLIIADIRGSRTALTPDGKIAVTYSSYLKAPTKDDVKYATIITYKQNDKIKYFIIDNFTTVKKNEDVKKYQNLLLPINISLGKLDENSFQISQVAVFTDGNKATRNIYSKITANIVLITTTDNYNTLSSIPSKVSEYTGNINNINILDLLNLD